jgi:hypothetical protein
MRKSLVILCVTVGLSLAQTIGAVTTWATFDIPGAGTASGQGTFVQGMDANRTVAGYYVDAANVFHGFTRTSAGTVTTFDVAGAGTGPSQGTVPQGSDGGLKGYIIDGGGIIHGFVGSIVFDVPGSVATMARGLNAGRSTGNYLDSSGASHGFIRDAAGAIKTLDVPGAGTGLNEGTFPQTMDGGGITGYYIDAAGVGHGFFRNSTTLAITTFDVPGAGSGPGQGTYMVAPYVGSYLDASNVRHGFSGIGPFTTLDCPGTTTRYTFATSRGQSGITGSCADAKGIHGFLLHSGIVKFDAPGASPQFGTFPMKIINQLWMAGFFYDANSVAHGFQRH